MTTTKQQTKAEATRARILAATRELMLGEGPTSFTAIAARAGISVGGVQNHFRSKADLVAATLDQVLADWHFYLACNFFRLAAILQGIAKRVLDGIAASPIAVETGRMAGPMAEVGWQLARTPRS